MSFLPGKEGMMLLYGFWGLTSIFLFWAALIRATREWGGDNRQGRAFGWLEGGRGAAAALLASLALLVFADFNPDSANQAILSAARITAFRKVILFTSLFTFVSGTLVWFFIPDNKELRPVERVRTEQIILLLKSPSIWILSIIIICAYVGYKVSDDLALYANQVLGFDEVKSAGLGTAALWMRALVAILAAYLADKIKASRIIAFSFFLTLISSALVASGLLESNLVPALINLALVMVGVYGIRALYFALVHEARIPILYTGTAVGIISVLGFTPDIFMSPWMGHILDNNPGAEGHRLVFVVLFVFAVVGLVASITFIYHSSGGHKNPKI